MERYGGWKKSRMQDSFFIDRGYKERKPNKTYANVKSFSEATKLILTRGAR